MSTVIEAVFERGVFRPLIPVAIADNLRVKLWLDDSDVPASPDSPPAPHPPVVYPKDPSDFSESESGYLPVPMKAAGTRPARFVAAGAWTPPAYSSE